MDARHAASTGVKPVESQAPLVLDVAANYRPTGIEPVVAKHRKDASKAMRFPFCR